MIEGVSSVFPPIQWKTEHQCFPSVNDAQRINERQESNVILYDKNGNVHHADHRGYNLDVNV